MMKKRNEEGFALAYVVVVIFILCSIAIVLMSSTLRTLQAQEIMVQRMKDKYEAMGEIERLVAELEAEIPALEDGLAANGFERKSDAKIDALNAFNSCMSSYGEDLDSSTDYVFNLSHNTDCVRIDAEIRISPNISFDSYLDTIEVPNDLEPGTMKEETVTRWKYDVTLKAPVFSSYTVTTKPNVEGGET